MKLKAKLCYLIHKWYKLYIFCSTFHAGSVLCQNCWWSPIHDDHLNAFKVSISRNQYRFQMTTFFSSHQSFFQWIALIKNRSLNGYRFLGRIYVSLAATFEHCDVMRHYWCHYILCSTSLPLSAVSHQIVYFGRVIYAVGLDAGFSVQWFSLTL